MADRPIKFRQAIYIYDPRAKRYGKFKFWHYWGFVDGKFIGPLTGTCSIEEALKNSYQYIRHNDKNGHEIYEKDFIISNWHWYPVEIVWGGYWNYAAFGMHGKRRDRKPCETEYFWDVMNPEHANKCEVVGNTIEGCKYNCTICETPVIGFDICPCCSE